MNKKALGAAVTLLVLVGAIVAWHFLMRPSPDPQKATEVVDVVDFDQFQQSLASRVLDRLGKDDGLSVVVADFGYPIGTLLRPEGSIPADSDDCLPKQEPKSLPLQHLFPDYRLSAKTALDAKTGPSQLQNLVTAGLDFQHVNEVQYSIADAQAQILDDKSVASITGQGDCKGYIDGHPGVRLILGAVLGKMTFTMKVDNPGSVKASLSSVANMEISDDPQSSSLTVNDHDPEPIVQVLTQIKGTGQAQVSTAAKRPLPVETAPPPPGSKPTSGNKESATGPHIYLQMDKADTDASGAAMLALLKQEWPRAQVEPKIEKIPSKNMPAHAQVRFFNAPDEGIADKCVAIVKQKYPTAQVVRIGLTSPASQIEVWLPRVQNNDGSVKN